MKKILTSNLGFNFFLFEPPLDATCIYYLKTVTSGLRSKIFYMAFGEGTLTFWCSH